MKKLPTLLPLTAVSLGLTIMSSTTGSTAPADAAYREAVLKTATMSQNADAQALAGKFDLQILDLTWEDTGRYQDSSVGPNISDMTIQVAVDQAKGRGQTVHCMPVIRFPNFTDKTADLDPEKFFLLVGNEKGQPLRRITLREFLEHPTLYLHDAGSWSGEGRRSLLAPKRDSRVLVSAQACFLPVPRKGKATFNPVLFNYQSVKQDPAVLTILVTREGTSTTVIDNTRDAFEEGSAWGQRLFFNQDGERASLTGERESDFKADPDNTAKLDTEVVEAAGEAGMNLVLLIQVPLKQRNPMRLEPSPMAVYAVAEAAAPMARERSDVENAVIGHGELEGPFTEIDRLPIERDPKFPVRVTVQFYKATSNGVVSEDDLRAIRDQIDRVYAEGDYVGSLVTDGDTGRATEYDGPKVQPADWWEQFWKRHEENTGDSHEEAIKKLRKLLGDDYLGQPVEEDYLRAILSSTDLPEGVEPREPEPEVEKKKGFLQKLFGK